MAYNIFTNILKDLGDGEQAQYIKDKITINLTGQLDPNLDPFSAYVKSTLRFNSIITNDDKGITWSNNGVSLSAVDPVEGDNCAEFSLGDYIATTESTPFIIGTADFCFETYINSSAATEQYGTIIRGDNPNYALLRFNSGKIEFDAYGFGGVTTTNTHRNDGIWTHIAVSRESGTLRIFVDGTKVDEWTGKTASIWEGGGSSNIKISQPGVSERIVGFLDRVKITIGHARYTTNFTPNIY